MGEYRIDAGNTIEAVAHRESGTRRIPRTGIERLATLRRRDHTELPTANHMVQNASTVQQGLTFSERQCVERGCHKAVGNVERGNSIVTGAATRVLGCEVE